MVLELLVPLLFLGVCIYAMAGRRDVYSLMVTGAEQGLRTVLSILPSLVVLLALIHMLRTSGAIDRMTAFLTPLCQRLGIPPETVPLVVIRPISGSAGLAVGSEIIAAHGPDSEVGRIAAIMLGSTETTFYTISVYFGAAKIKKTRHTVAAALIADLVGFWMAGITARLLF
ncbi:MAG: spore maturation protein [Oscillospiraceae bacterium]|nr:spore maturation protein [Oscillospiraceae bacterium]